MTRASARISCSARACAPISTCRPAKRTATAAPYSQWRAPAVLHAGQLPASTTSFDIAGAGTLTARFDLINVFDKDYQIRNGTGVGVGAPQYGPRRGFFFGLSKSIGSGT